MQNGTVLGTRLLDPLHGSRRRHFKRPTVGADEVAAAIVITRDVEATLVYKPVVCAAQHQQIIETRRTAIGPVLNMVGIEVSRLVAAGKRTEAIARV